MKTILLACAVLSATSLYGASEFVPLAEKAQGQSLTGALLKNDSIFSNPASFTFGNVYSVDGTFAMPSSFAISVLDTQTSSIGGGLGYFKKNLDYSDESLQGFRFALGGRVSNVVGIGVTGKALWGPNRQAENVSHKDLDLGVVANLGFVQAGMTATNVLGGSVPLEQDRELITGGRIGYDNTLFLSAAAHSKFEDISPYQYSVGTEYMSPFYFALRAGYRVQPRNNNQSWWGLGASFMSPRLSIHYAVELANQNQNETEHLLGASMQL